MEINGVQHEETIRYDELPISSQTLQALSQKGFEIATPIQGGAIPFLMDWKDVVAKAPTGTGKTFAFGIPILEHIDPDSEAVQALILAPTRELAIQIRDELRDLCLFRQNVRSVCLYGGQPIEKQIKQLKAHPQIVVATPGRLMDHQKRRTVRLDKVETVVLDEADRMLDMGFIDDVIKILDSIPNRRNLGLFSATISREVMDISWVYQRDPAEITVRPVAENKPDIQQYRILLSDRGQKLNTLLGLLEGGGYERTIAFCNTKNMADRLAALLQQHHISAKAIHGDIPQRDRERTLTSFRTGLLRVLVATDVAARGLDIDDVDAVFNYDVPDENEYYIHRIGRTGRAKKHGVSYTFVSTVAEELKLDEIIRSQKFSVQTLKYDEDGCLMLVEDKQ